MRHSAADRVIFRFHGISVATSGSEVLVSTLSRLGLAVAIPILMVGGLFTPQLASVSRIGPIVGTAHTAPIADDARPEARNSDRDEMSDADRPVDLYGNEVSDAVAEYKLDATGSLYETHSPQTELPRLGSPKG